MTYGRQRPNYLFSDADIVGVVTARGKQLKDAIEALDRNRALSASMEDLVAYFASEYELDTPVIDRAAASVDQNEGKIEIFDSWRCAHDAEEGPLILPGTIIDLVVPFTGDAGLFKVRPSSWSTVQPIAEIRSGTLVIKISGKDLDPAKVKGDLVRQLDLVEEYLTAQRSDTSKFNSGLRDSIRQQLETRRKKLLADQDLVSGLGFTLRERADAPKTYRAPIERRRLAPQPPAAAKLPYKPEPVLAEAEYGSILDIMGSMALVMERSPSAFETIAEEDLRQHFLVQLNGQYEGQASGETFNYQGKTDILVRVEGRNIFVAECKYWRGEKGHTETIDQIMSYLSWRDTKAAIVIFNRNKGFSEVLEKIKTSTAAHTLCKSGPSVEAETRFRYVFGQKDDPAREVVLTVLAFDVPKAGTDVRSKA